MRKLYLSWTMAKATRNVGPRIVAARRLRGLSQRDLAKRSTVGVGTVIAAERGRPLRLSSMKKLALALGREIPQLFDLVSRLRPTDVPGFLVQQTMPEADRKIVEAARTATVEDMSGRFEAAQFAIDSTLRETSTEPGQARDHLILRQAISLDNAGKSAQAIGLLEQLRKANSRPDRLTPLDVWILYHLGIARRRMAERGESGFENQLDEAERLLMQVASRKDHEQSIAAVHQLGCLHLVRARHPATTQRRSGEMYRRATRHFEMAQRKWKKIGNFREGYAHRRLGEIARRIGDRRLAFGHLMNAFEVFVRHDCYRYRDSVRHEIDELF